MRHAAAQTAYGRKLVKCAVAAEAAVLHPSAYIPGPPENTVSHPRPHPLVGHPVRAGGTIRMLNKGRARAPRIVICTGRHSWCLCCWQLGRLFLCGGRYVSSPPPSISLSNSIPYRRCTYGRTNHSTRFPPTGSRSRALMMLPPPPPDYPFPTCLANTHGATSLRTRGRVAMP